VGKTVTFSGFGLTQNAIVTGGTSSNFALPVACCAPFVGRTTGNIIPAPIIVVPPVVVVPPVAPPVVVVPPEVVVPPVVVVQPEAPAPVALAPEAPQFEFAPETLPVQNRINLTVIDTGIRMPLVAAYTPPPPVVVPPVVVPPVVPPPVFVPPQPPPRKDRN
jgi:hypothetical protein